MSARIVLAGGGETITPDLIRELKERLVLVLPDSPERKDVEKLVKSL